MPSQKPTILIASGGSGGHIFPALAVAEELEKAGATCVFVGTGDKLAKMVPDRFRVENLPAAKWNVRNPLRKLWALVVLALGLFRALKLILQVRPSAVFGTGGYATVAAVTAGKISGVPTVVQDQNVLPGRANRLLARWVDKVCISFQESRAYLDADRKKAVVCGNPVRAEVLAVMGEKRPKNGPFHVVVVGGSQGARVLSTVVPEAVCRLPETLRQNLKITHQARPEDVESVRARYAELKVQAEVETFFDDLPQRMARGHFMISRAGASAVQEAATLGRAALFVPLRLADGHQVLNASVMAEAGAAYMVEEVDFTAPYVAKRLQTLIEQPQKRERMERAALKLARPDAAQKVAAVVLALAENDVLTLAD